MSFRTLPLLIILMIAFTSCQDQGNDDLKKELESSLSIAAEQYELTAESLIEDKKFPKTFDEGQLITRDNSSWTSGYFPGVLWYLYQWSDKKSLKKYAEAFTQFIIPLQSDTTNPDLGWIFVPSVLNAYQLTHDSRYEDVLDTATKSLLTWYKTSVGLVRTLADTPWARRFDFTYPVSIDNLLNMELLINTARYSGDSTFYRIALSHADSTLKTHYRPDYSSYHMVDFNPETGEVIKKVTAQGYANESSWARGQAWGLYGFTMMYRETKELRYLDHARKIAEFILNHPRLPKDKIPYWDFDDPDIPNTYRDASSAAVMCSALIELSGYVNEAESAEYLRVAKQQLKTLSSEEYRAPLGENGNFILKHSVGGLPVNIEVDVPLSYADYYYIEAILRYLNL